jgi:hypothetical protein
MTGDDVGRLFDLAAASFDRAAASSIKANRAIERADAVMARAQVTDSAVRAASRRERDRLNSGLKRNAFKIAGIVAAVWIGTIVIGLIKPIGLFGLIAAIVIGTLLVGWSLKGKGTPARPALPAPDLPNGAVVDRLDSYLYRVRPALPAPAQAEVDAMLSRLPDLKQTLDRVDTLDPNAQDARRLMASHLPNLIDKYLNVPKTYRSEQIDEDVSPNQRLVEALRTGRTALDDIGEQLAKGDLAAFETQGRFISSRYSEEPIDS